MKIDALDDIIGLFGTGASAEKKFIDAFISSVIFLPVEKVAERNWELISLYNSDQKIPVRFSRKADYCDVTNSLITLHNNKLGNEHSLAYDTYFLLPPSSAGASPVRSSEKLLIDADGNREVRNVLKIKTGHIVSQGYKLSTVRNYIISHVWGRAADPLFYTSLWNIVLVPAHFNYILDKDPMYHPVIKKIQDKIQCICKALYEPYYNLSPSLPGIIEYKSLLTPQCKWGSGGPLTLKFLEPDGVVKKEVSIKNYTDSEGNDRVDVQMKPAEDGDNENISKSTMTCDICKKLESVKNSSKDFSAEEITELIKDCTLSLKDTEAIQNHLNRMGTRFFLDYFEEFANGEDLKKVIKPGKFTDDSIKTRISTIRTIFTNNLECKALIYIISRFTGINHLPKTALSDALYLLSYYCC